MGVTQPLLLIRFGGASSPFNVLQYPGLSLLIPATSFAMPTLPLLELRHLTKTYPNVAALDDFSLDIQTGEIHVLLGELGAGKTTLLRILAGIHPHSAFKGEIVLNGQVVQFDNPADAIRAGISVVMRRVGMFEQLTVAENIVMGRWEHQNRFFIRSGEVQKQAQAALDMLHLHLPLEAKVGQLNPTQQRLLMIARAVSVHPYLVVLDEPTTNLTTPEAISQLVYAVRRLPALGITCLYLSRRLPDAVQIGDRVTILRDGRAAGTYEREYFDEAEMGKAMVSQRLGDIEHIDVDEKGDGAGGLTGLWKNLFSPKR